MRPNQFPRIPTQPPGVPARPPPDGVDPFPKLPLPPTPCDFEAYDKCRKDAYYKYLECANPKIVMTSSGDELEPLRKKPSDCFKIYTNAVEKCGCGSGTCTPYDFCCPFYAIPCISATKGNQCLPATTKCGENEEISASCECICKPGYKRCGKECVDLQSDYRYCGSCDHSCMSESCEGGKCKCPPDKPYQCDFNPRGSNDTITQCSNFQDDKYNCGGCGTKGSDHRCGLQQECYMGECRCKAKQNLDGVWYQPGKCGKQCVDFKTDGANCGGCGKVCGGDTYCVNGTCGCPFSSTPDKCGDKCVNFKNDMNNCGECGKTCQNGCAGGKCCDPGTKPCGNDCCLVTSHCCRGPGNDTGSGRTTHCEDAWGPKCQDGTAPL